MKIRLFGIAQESIVDGPGLRLGIFTQGCLHDCKGCQNPGSHPLNGGKLRDTDEIVELMKNPMLDGITLSGGEPFLQPRSCAELAREAHARGLTVWCYTGYTYEQLVALGEPKTELLNEVDVLVDGRFDITQRSLDLYYKGSKNQRTIDVMETRKAGKIILVSP